MGSQQNPAETFQCLTDQIPEDADRSLSSRLFSALAILFVAGNALTTAYRVRSDMCNLAFVALVYSCFVTLLIGIHALEKNWGGPQRAARLKAAIWAVATLLLVSFVWRISRMMPPALAAVAWALVVIFSFGSFYALILHRPPPHLLVLGEDGCACKTKPLLDNV